MPNRRLPNNLKHRREAKVPEKKNVGARQIYKYNFMNSTLPFNDSFSSLDESIERVPEEKDHGCTISYIQSSTTTQSMLRNNKFVCQCPQLNRCCKLATLHEAPCSFCHGFPPGGPPYILRYYPEDRGWWTLRHQAQRLREAAGLENIKEVLPITLRDYLTFSFLKK